MSLVRSWHVICSVAASSVLTCESTESVTFVDESESSQREVVNDSPRRVDFQFWQLTLQGHFSDDWLTAVVHANCLPAKVLQICSSPKWIVLVLRTKRLIYAINDRLPTSSFGSTIVDTLSIGYLFFTSPSWFGTAPTFRSETTDCARYCEFFYILMSLLDLLCLKNCKFWIYFIIIIIIIIIIIYFYKVGHTVKSLCQRETNFIQAQLRHRDICVHMSRQI